MLCGLLSLTSYDLLLSPLGSGPSNLQHSQLELPENTALMNILTCRLSPMKSTEAVKHGSSFMTLNMSKTSNLGTRSHKSLGDSPQPLVGHPWHF